jgi:hypothetical protein
MPQTEQPTVADRLIGHARRSHRTIFAVSRHLRRKIGKLDGHVLAHKTNKARRERAPHRAPTPPDTEKDAP